MGAQSIWIAIEIIMLIHKIAITLLFLYHKRQQVAQVHTQLTLGREAALLVRLCLAA
jgi:hypothetical protein